MVVLVLSAPWLSFIEVRALDVLLALRSAGGADPRVATIEVGADPAVFDYLRDPRDSATDGFTVPRRAYAEAVRRLSRWGAKVVVLDLMFRRRSQYEDAEFAQAIRRAGNVVVAASTRTRPGAVELREPVPPLDDAVWAVGSPAAYQPNETVRSVPLVVRDNDTGHEYLAMCVLALQRFTGAASSDMRLIGDRWLLTAHRRIPLLSGERIELLPGSGSADAGDSGEGAVAGVEVVRGDNIQRMPALRTWNAMLINWAGPQGTIEPRLLDQVLALDDDSQGRRLYGGKAVIIGRPEGEQWDEHWTAVGAMSGLEIQANALQTLISGAFIRPASPWGMLALLALLALATSAAVCRLNGARAIGAVALLMVAALVLAHQLLVHRGVWVYLFCCELSIGLTWGLTTATESGKVTALLGRFVPSFMGKAQAPRPGEVRTLDASLLYSDIRGYTGAAEQLSATDTLNMLNTYHSAVEDIIAEYGGTIVKTPGDAVLAVFWQKRDGLNHADCALRAGLEILANLPRLAQTWEAAGLSFNIGVGINAGPVAMGLVGKHHLEPTVIGDAVNVAQRLESLTKTAGYPLIFSESLRARLRQEVDAVRLDEVTLEGRKAPVTLYGVPFPERPGQAPEEGHDFAKKERAE